MESQFEQQPAMQAAPGTTTGGAQAGMDLKLDEALTDQMRVALHDLVAAAHACEWCAERCIDEGPEMAECLRLCRDVADLASLNVRLITRDSVFGPETAEVFVAAADACARECAQHPHRHCQECAEVLPRAIQSVRTMLDSIGGPGSVGEFAGGQFQGGIGQTPQQPQPAGIGQAPPAGGAQPAGQGSQITQGQGTQTTGAHPTGQGSQFGQQF